jgi:hypothetical protein
MAEETHSKDNIKTDIREIGCEDAKGIELA